MVRIQSKLEEFLVFPDFATSGNSKKISPKKVFSPPVLHLYGDVRNLTQAGTKGKEVKGNQNDTRKP